MEIYQPKNYISKLNKLNESISVKKLFSLLYYEFDKNYIFDGERHDFWEIVYLDKGEIIATADETDVFLKQGEMIFHKPNEFHKLRSNGMVAPNVFIITFSCPSEGIRFFESKHLKLPEEHRWLIKKIIEEGKHTFLKNSLKRKENPKLGGEQLIKNYLEILLIHLMREDEKTIFFSDETTIENHIVCDIIRLLEDALYDEIDIPVLCKKMNYSKTYLCTLFKKYTNTSIMQYYTQMKIMESKRLIREKSYNISQISDLLKFNNSHYFSNVFKKQTGMSPREYSKSVNS